MGPEVEDLKTTKVFYPYWDSNPGSSSPYPSHCMDYAVRTPNTKRRKKKKKKKKAETDSRAGNGQVFFNSSY